MATGTRATAKRRQILAAGAELFGRQGFAATSMRELAAHAGVSTATLYAHFPTKEVALDAVCKELFDGTMEELLAATNATEDPLEKAVLGLDVVHRLLATNPLFGRFITESLHLTDPLLAERARAIQDRLDMLGMMSVRAAVAAGRLECNDAEALVALSRAVMHGWWVGEARRPTGVSLERVMAMFIDMIRARARPIR